MEEGTPKPGTPLTGDQGVLPRFQPSQVTAHTVVVVLLTAVAVLVGLYLLWLLRDIVRWCVIAIFLAATLNPVVDWLQRHRIKRSVAILIVYLALLVFFAGLGALVLPPLVDQIQQLVNYVVDLTNRPGGINQALQDLATRYGFTSYVDEIRSQISTLPTRLGTAAGPLLDVTRGIISSITAMLSILLLTFFLLLDGDRFLDTGLLLFSKQQRPRMRRVLTQSARAIRGYVSGNLTISLIAGVAVYIVLKLLGMPFAVALALVVAVFDLIPLVGATIGSLIVVVVALFVDPVKGVILLAYFLVYQQIENNVLQPLVYGRSVRLHPLAVFIAILAGSELLGILGALIAIPVAEIIRILGAEWFASRAKATGGDVHGAQEQTPVDEVAADAIGPLA